MYEHLTLYLLKLFNDSLYLKEKKKMDDLKPILRGYSLLYRTYHS